MVKQLAETASNAMMYIIVILLGTSVGATTSAEAFLNWTTIKIVALGLIAFAGNSIRCPVWQNYVQSNRRQGKSSDWFRGRIRSTDGSPCFSESRCRRGSDKFPADACHGPNVAGVIGTAVAAGVFMAIFGA